MGAPNELSGTIRWFLNAMQEAWDSSPEAEASGQCLPVEEWLTAVLAAYAKSEAAGEAAEDSDREESEDDGDWLKEEYWQDKLLSIKDVVYGHPVAENEINLRPEPNLSCKPLTVIPCMEFFSYFKKADGSIESKNGSGKTWYHVNFKGQEGYVARDNVMDGLSPVTCGYYQDPNGKLKAMASTMLNAGKASYRVFNRIHMYPGDFSLTLGFAHFASENGVGLLERLRSEPKAFRQFCRYLAYRLCTDRKSGSAYPLQAANDPLIRQSLFPERSTEIKPEELAGLSPEQWLAAMDAFFSKSAVLRAAGKDGGARGEISGSMRNSLDAWAEKQFASQKSGELGSYSRGLTYEKDDGSKTKIPNLFPSSDPDTTVNGFWFYDLVKDALRLKTTADVQVKFWEEHYYDKARTQAGTLRGVEGTLPERDNEALILSLVSWKNTGGRIKSCGIADKLEIPEGAHLAYAETEETPEGTKPLPTRPSPRGKLYTLLNSGGWLFYLEESQFEDSEQGRRDAEDLLVWLSYNHYYSRKCNKPAGTVRGRMRVIWNRFMKDKWEVKSGVAYPASTRDIVSYRRG